MYKPTLFHVIFTLSQNFFSLGLFGNYFHLIAKQKESGINLPDS